MNHANFLGQHRPVGNLSIWPEPCPNWRPISHFLLGNTLIVYPKSVPHALQRQLEAFKRSWSLANLSTRVRYVGANRTNLAKFLGLSR